MAKPLELKAIQVQSNEKDADRIIDELIMSFAKQPSIRISAASIASPSNPMLSVPEKNKKSPSKPKSSQSVAKR